MGFGFEKHFICGTLVATPILRQNDKNENYCYFDLVVNFRQPANAEHPKAPRYYSCVANKFHAKFICDKLVKGDMVAIEANTRAKKNEVVKDGKVYVYNDIEWVVTNILEPFPKMATRKSDAPAAPAPKPAAPPAGNASQEVPEPDYSDPTERDSGDGGFALSDEERDAVGELPF